MTYEETTGITANDTVPVRLRRIGVVHATQLTADHEWRTPTGDVLHGQAGDWLVRPEEGGAERTITDEVFRRTHAHLHADLWERTGTVQAWQVATASRIVTLEGEATAQAGDWILEGANGDRWPVSDEYLQLHYVQEHAP